MLDPDDLTEEQLTALTTVRDRILNLRKSGNEQAAYDAMTAAIKNGELTEELAALGYYEETPDDYICPTWFTRWKVARERERAKAAGLPYEHINAL